MVVLLSSLLLLGCDNKGLLITLHLNKKFPPGWMDWSANIWSLVPSTDQLKQSQDQLSGQLGPGVAITKFKNGYISFVYFQIIIMVTKEFDPVMNSLLMSLEIEYVNSIVFTNTTSLSDIKYTLTNMSIDI